MAKKENSISQDVQARHMRCENIIGYGVDVSDIV